jgi:F-type H+-transporting ATPase subunit gamma
MNLVAASKLQKTRTRMDSIRPMYDNIQSIMDSIKSRGGISGAPYTEQREVKNVVYVVFTSDRGLCGGYNINMGKEVMSCIESNKGAREKIICVGSKGVDYLRRRDKNITHRFIGASETSVYKDAEEIGKSVVSMYDAGDADEVYLIYTKFESILSHIPQSLKLLPITPDPEAEDNSESMAYEPEISTFISYAVPMYLNMVIYGAMMESSICEWASRMTSMDAASRNAAEIIDDLTLEYNRMRQGMITQEITEIVSGANALQ